MYDDLAFERVSAGGGWASKLKQNERLASSEKNDREDVTRQQRGGKVTGNRVEMKQRSKVESRKRVRMKEKSKRVTERTAGGKGESEREREREREIWGEREMRRERARNRRARKRG